MNPSRTLPIMASGLALLAVSAFAQSNSAPVNALPPPTTTTQASSTANGSALPPPPVEFTEPAATPVATTGSAETATVLVPSQFDSADADGDGRISRSEFTASTVRTDSSGAASAAAFTKLDANNDGFISQSELSAAQNQAR